MGLRIAAFNTEEENYTATIEADSIEELNGLRKRYPLAERISVRHEPKPRPPPGTGAPVIRQTWRTGNQYRPTPIIGLSLPKQLSEEIGIVAGSKIEIEPAEGCLIIRPVRSKGSR